MKVRELFSSPEKWTQGANARDKDGIPVGSKSSPDAVSFCLWGGLIHCYGESEGSRLATVIEQALASEQADGLSVCVVSWNDDPSRKFEDVKAIADRLDI